MALDRPRVITWLLVLAASSWLGVSAGHAEDVGPDGEQVFYFSCATCHLGRGALLGRLPPPDLLRDPLRHGDDPKTLETVIRNGTGSPLMPGFAQGLSDAEIRSLVRYIVDRRQPARSDD